MKRFVVNSILNIDVYDDEFPTVKSVLDLLYLRGFLSSVSYYDVDEEVVFYG